MGFRVPWQAGREPGRFHLVASGLSTTAMALQLHRVFGGKPLVGAPHLDRLASRVHIRFAAPQTYTLDGELFRATRGGARHRPAPGDRASVVRVAALGHPADRLLNLAPCSCLPLLLALTRRDPRWCFRSCRRQRLRRCRQTVRLRRRQPRRHARRRRARPRRRHHRRRPRRRAHRRPRLGARRRRRRLVAVGAHQSAVARRARQLARRRPAPARPRARRSARARAARHRHARQLLGRLRRRPSST